MNNKKRGMLNEATSLLTQVISITKRVRDAEEDSLENLPESFEDTDRYESMENAIDDLEDALDDLESAKENIEAACGR